MSLCKFCGAAGISTNGLCRKCHSNITRYKRYSAAAPSLEQKVFMRKIEEQVRINKKLDRYVPKFLSEPVKEKVCKTCSLSFDTRTEANICETCNKRERSLIALHKLDRPSKALEKHMAHYEMLYNLGKHVPKIFHTIRGGD